MKIEKMANEDVNVETQEELAEKLDKDLNEHMERMLIKNKNYKYTDGLTMENLEEQCKLIPAFSDGAPSQEEIDASPALQALQAIKYECDNPEEGALAHKDDGNYHFQKKDYKTAIIAYSEALRQKHNNTHLYAIIYTNRAASHFYLGNNGSALKDAMWALKFEPNHMKAIVRCATCCFDLEKYDQCVEWCERGISINNNEEKLNQMKKKCSIQKKIQEREKRKKELRVVKDLKKRNDLINAIKSRSITVQGSAKTLQHRIEAVLDIVGKPESSKIYLDDNQHLHWPFYFVYPEFSQSDFIEDFDEELTIADQLKVVFNSPAPWDVDKVYNVDNLEIYFEDLTAEKLVRIKAETSLKRILSCRRFTLTGPAPVLMVMSKVTDFYKHTFENQHSVDF